MGYFVVVRVALGCNVAVDRSADYLLPAHRTAVK